MTFSDVVEAIKQFSADEKQAIQVPALAEHAKTWNFLEIWVDPVLFPPKILMVVGDRDGTCRIFNPSSGYQLVVLHQNYQAAQEWLLEDEYERVKGKLLAEEAL